MRILQETLRAAIAQASPALFDKRRRWKKSYHKSKKPEGMGHSSSSFPNPWVPCYPYGLTFGFTVGSRSEAERADWKRYYEESVVVSRDLESVAAAAKAFGIYVSLGITERDETTYSLLQQRHLSGPTAP